MVELVILDIKWHDWEHKGFMRVIADECVRKCNHTQMRKIIDLAGESDKNFGTDNPKKIYTACQKYEKELKATAKEQLDEYYRKRDDIFV